MHDDDVVLRIQAEVVISKRPQPAMRFRITDEGGNEVMEYVIDEGKKRVAIATPVDQQGNPAEIQGFSTWSVAPAGVIQLNAWSDGSACELIYESGPGAAVVTVSGTNTKGAPISGTVDITTTAATTPDTTAIGYAIEVGDAAPMMKGARKLRR